MSAGPPAKPAENDDAAGDNSLIGAALKRTDDPALLTGRGRFVDDLHLPGLAQAAFLRSPHAHAAIRTIDTTAARAAQGVLAVYTLADLAPHLTSETMPPAMPDHPALRIPSPLPVLARDEVRYVGEPVAVVVAGSRYEAEDAAALIEVDYDPLPVIADCRDALEPGAPRAHSGTEDNIVGGFKLEYGDGDTAFAAAPHVFNTAIWQQRGVSHPMEGRGLVALHDPIGDSLTVWTSSQVPHTVRAILAKLYGWDETRLRVIAPDVGGGFGPKIVTYPEEGVVPLAARLLGRPVKWIEDRREHFIATAQERDQYWDVSVAVDRDGKLIGVRGTVIHDHGAYSARGINVPYSSGMVMPGPYVVPHFKLDITLALTNKVPVASVRGAGHPQGTFAMERLMDLAADGIGMDRAEIRLRNLIQADAMPYEVPLRNRQGVGIVYDSGDYPASQRAAMDAVDYDGFKTRQAAALNEGRHIGLALANYVKGTGLGPFETAGVRIAPSGTVLVFSGATDQGQGLRMMLRQVVAQTLGAALDDIEVIAGDTATIAHGLGAYASRQTALAGSAAMRAAESVREKVLKVAAILAEAAEEDLDIKDGVIRVKGVPEPALSLADIAATVAGQPGVPLPGGVDPGLEASVSFAPEAMTYCNGVHAAEVEVDAETGAVTITRYVVIDDCGRKINPMIVDGQLQGGVVHGLGNALFEWMGYDDNAQPLTTNFAEYTLPTAPEVPGIEIVPFESPSPLNPLGVKGVGEGGTVPAAAAVIGAIEDALKPFGVRIDEAPLRPGRLVELIRAARGR